MKQLHAKAALVQMIAATVLALANNACNPIRVSDGDSGWSPLAEQTPVDVFNEGLRALHDRQYEAAITRFSYAIAKRQLQFGAYLHRGQAFAALRDWQPALRDFSTASRLKPHEPYPYELRGRALTQMGDTNEAIAALSQAILLTKSPHAPHHYWRGLAYFAERNYSRALLDLNLAIKSQNARSARSLRARYHYYRGLTHRELGRHKRSRADLENAYRIIPPDDYLIDEIAVLLKEMDRPTECPSKPGTDASQVVSVAVIDFDVPATASADLGTVVADACRGVIWSVSGLILVERERMKLIFDEEDLMQSIQCDDTKCLVRYGRKLRAQKIVHGRVSDISGNWHVTVQMIDVASGAVDAIKSSNVDRVTSELLKQVRANTCETIMAAFGR